MYAIMLKDEGCLGLVGEPFRDVSEAFAFIYKNGLLEEYDDVYLLRAFLNVTELDKAEDKIFLTDED